VTQAAQRRGAVFVVGRIHYSRLGFVVGLVVGLVVALAGDLGRELAVELASELASSHFVKLVVVMRTVLALQVVVDIELGLASERMVHCAQPGAGRGLEAGRELVAGRELGVACPPSQ
jgi:hypothetical protein